MAQSKRIGILTSGGDCPGLNAIIRAVVKCATYRQWDVYGIPYSVEGLLELESGRLQTEDLKLRDHGYDIPGLLKGLDILQFLSGSILGSVSKGNPGDPVISKGILKGYQLLDLDALIAVGGDGSIEIIYDLAQKGDWNLIAIPKTIDNDVPFTERSVGFDTAVNTVTEAIYKLTFTAASHERIMVVEVMGRDAGHLALSAGIAGGADVILIPELVPQLTLEVVDQICTKIAHLNQLGRKFALVVVAEGVRGPGDRRQKYIGDFLAEQIQERSKVLCDTGNPEFCNLKTVDTRATILGHVQRSGTPSSYDRLLATMFGKKAVDLIAEEQYNRLVVWRNSEVHSEPLDEVIAIIKHKHQSGQCPGPVDPASFLVKTAHDLGIYVGLHN